MPPPRQSEISGQPCTVDFMIGFHVQVARTAARYSSAARFEADLVLSEAPQHGRHPTEHSPGTCRTQASC
jgi:hypothetical protein